MLGLVPLENTTWMRCEERHLPRSVLGLVTLVNITGIMWWEYHLPRPELGLEDTTLLRWEE